MEPMRDRGRHPRTKPVLVRLCVLFLFSGALVAGGPTATPDLALTGGTVYRSPEEAPVPDGSVLMREGRIVSVGSRAQVSIPPGTRAIDCAGLIVTAGFWNSHVHIITPGLLHAKEASAETLQGQLDEMFNRWGFTTVFDLASVLDNTLELRRRIASGELRGPRILTTGEPIWTIEPVYIRDFVRQQHLHFPNTDAPAQAIALVRDHVAKGADGIKLFTGSYQGDSQVVALPIPIAKAAVSEAHKHRLPVFAHPQDAEGVGIAIESGVDVLAHTVPQSPPWDQAYVQRLKRAHLALIPTLTLFDAEARKGGASDRERNAWIAQMVAELRAYSRAGGTILFGTDIGYIDHYDTALEFNLMARADMTWEQILASLTTEPATEFGDGSHHGRIEPGLAADVVVLKTDPARDPEAFSRVQYTIRAGVVTYAATQRN